MEATMKKTTTKASKGAATAFSWDILWADYIAAQKSGDVSRQSAAKAAIRGWHAQHGFAIPDYAAE
jgi:hypothetical protein